MAGAMSSPSLGWSAAYSMASMKAKGTRPSCRARFSLISSTADAPSVTGDELPAVAEVGQLRFTLRSGSKNDLAGSCFGHDYFS